MANREKVTLVAVGEINHTGADPGSIFALAAPILREANIAFCQLEEVLSERVDPAYTLWVAEDPTELGKVLANAGFNVISTAGNHTMICGPEAVVDTLNILKQNNILPVGAGINIAEARAPAIVERKGTKVAFLGYSSHIPRCELPWEARLNGPGCAPMYINTFYDQINYQPGTPPRIITFAEKANLAAMVEDIGRAKAQADVVVMSIHWGVPQIPAAIAMYEYEVGHAAIDAGVDLILGHGPHLLKGIEVYKGKVVFHSLGDFAYGYNLDTRKPGLLGYWEGLPRLRTAWPPEERKGLIAKCIVSDKKIEKVSFQPLMINEAHQSEPLFRKDMRSDKIYEYVEWACKEAGLDTTFSREGDEVVILT